MNGIKQQSMGESNDTKYFKRLLQAVDIIKNEGPIKRYQLALALKLTARQYDSFHQYLKDTMDDKVVYEKPFWRYLK